MASKLLTTAFLPSRLSPVSPLSILRQFSALTIRPNAGKRGGQFNRIIQNLFDFLVLENLTEKIFSSTKMSKRFSKRFSIILLNSPGKSNVAQFVREAVQWMHARIDNFALVRLNQGGFNSANLMTDVWRHKIIILWQDGLLFVRLLHLLLEASRGERFPRTVVRVPVQGRRRALPDGRAVHDGREGQVGQGNDSSTTKLSSK